jgi:ferredoxin-NADP reductase
VYAVIDQTPDVRSIRLARPKGFDFRAGQHLTVALGVDGQRVSRRVPISSAPDSIGYLEITLHRRGPVSGALYASMGVDRLLAVRPPSGSFVYPEGDDRPLLLVAGGIGCAPLMSMLRHAVETDPTRPVTFLLSVRAEQDIVFRQDLALLRRLHPRPRIAVTLTRESRPGYLSGRIGEAMLRRAAPDPASTIFCLCGPRRWWTR